MTILSNTQYEYRMDIIRKHIKIGQAKIKSCDVNFVENADVTRTLKAQIPIDGFNVDDFYVRQAASEVFFNGTRCFDGTWCFTSILGKWSKTTGEFDMFSDRLRPVMIINGTEYDFGDYMVISAPKTYDGKEYVYDIEAYDETMILKESAFVDRKYYPAGTSYLTIIGGLLSDCGLSKVVIEDSNARITIDHEYAIGTNYLSVVNSLLEEMGYSHIYSGAGGNVFLTRDTTKQTIDYSYNEHNSTIIDSVKQDTDIYSLPNVIVGYVSSPDINTVLKYKRVNDNPQSVISTVRRGYNVVQAYQFDDCPDASTLQRAVDQKFLEATQATETATIATMPDGNHGFGSYILLGIDGESSVFREVGWSITFGGRMTHNLERKAFV